MRLIADYLNQEFKSKRKALLAHIEELAQAYQVSFEQAYEAAKTTNLRRWFNYKIQSFPVVSYDYQEWINEGKLIYSLQSHKQQIHQVSQLNTKKRNNTYSFIKGFIPRHLIDEYDRWHHLLQVEDYKAQIEVQDIQLPQSSFMEHYETFLPENYQNYINLKPLVFTPYLPKILAFLSLFSPKAFRSAWIMNGFWLIETRYGLISISQLYKCFECLHSSIHLTGLEFYYFLNGLLNSPPFTILASQGFSTPFTTSSYWLHFLGESGWTSLSQSIDIRVDLLDPLEPSICLGQFEYQEFQMNGYRTRFRIQKPLEKPLMTFPEWEIWQFSDQSLGLVCRDFHGLAVFPPVEQDSDKGAEWPLFQPDLVNVSALDEIGFQD